MALPISDDAVIKASDSSAEDTVNNDIILNVSNNDIKVEKKSARICKAIFLGIPFGIPVFVLMLIIFSVLVASICLIFGAMVMASVLAAMCSLGFIILGISNVHISLAPSMLLIGAGILGAGSGIFLALITRLVFKYILVGLIKCYSLPVRFIKIFFGKKKEVENV